MKHSNCINKLLVTTAAVIALSGCQTIPLAGAVSGIMGLGASSGGADILSKQAEVIVSFNVALLGLSQANAKMASALGLQEDADLALNSAKTLEAGEITGKDEISSIVTSNNQISKNIVAKMAEKQVLNDSAKAEFRSALLPYGVGVVAGINGAKQAADSLMNATADPMQIMKLGTLIYLAKEGPGLIKIFSDTTGAIIDYAKFQGIDASAIPSGL